MTEWQDISNAPEKTYVLVYVPDARDRAPKVQTARWNMSGNDKPIWIIGNQFAFDVGKPTHWMPLPPAPQNTTGETK